jgi:hypothetical protein
MSAFECYKEYLALKNHFSKPSYDYFKYNGKSKLSYDKFETRSDKLFFQKIAKHPDPKNFLLANLLRDEKTWIKDIAYSEDANRVYQEWSKRIQSLTYVVKNDLGHLLSDFNSNFIATTGSHPHIVKLYLSNTICIETLIVLSDLVNCLTYWNKNMEYDPVWEQLSNKIKKYKPFINYDKAKMCKIVLDFYADL